MLIEQLHLLDPSIYRDPSTTGVLIPTVKYCR